MAACKVEGLRQKLDSADFVSFLLSLDVLRLPETFIDKGFESDVFGNYLSFTGKAKRLSHYVRNSGSVVALLK